MQRWDRYGGRLIRARARPALGVVICALAVGGLDCGPLNNTGQAIGDVARAVRDFLAETQAPGTLFRPSQYFCGNQVKPAGPVTGQCRGLATDDQGGIVATEGTQVRGKLVVAPGPNDCDPAEVCFTVELDHGWQQYSDPATVHALNTPANIVAAVTPHDLMQFSFSRTGGGLGPVSDTSGFHAWAGPPTLHVEADGYRLVRIGPNPSGAPLIAVRPSDWKVQRNSGGSLWPFDPMSPPTLSAAQGGLPVVGDYVQVSGTLWEDVYHPHSPGTGESGKTEQQANQARSAKDCWHADSLNRGSEGRGWSEIHPVDLFQRVNEVRPSGPRHDLLEMVALCGGGTFSYEIHVGQPRSGESIHFEEIVNSAFTVRPADVVTRSLTPIADGLHIALTLDRPGLFQGNPKFFAGYHVWIASP
jgi:hypothetical protein